jgi:hypothetical protein
MPRSWSVGLEFPKTMRFGRAGVAGCCVQQKNENRAQDFCGSLVVKPKEKREQTFGSVWNTVGHPKSFIGGITFVNLLNVYGMVRDLTFKEVGLFSRGWVLYH